MYFTFAFCTLNTFRVTVAHEVINRTLLQVVESGRQEEELKSLEYQIDCIE